MRELAKMAGMSKSAMRHRARKIADFKQYTSIGQRRNTILINSTGARRLLNIGRVKSSSQSSMSPRLMNHLLDENESLSKQNQRLTVLLSHEQQLRLLADKSNQKLKGQLQAPSNHHGWLWQLFH